MNNKTKFLDNKLDIIDWLKEYNIKRYTIKPNPKYGFIVDVHENVMISHGNLKYLPVKFNEIEGSFNFYGHRAIKNFMGCPSIVRGNFNWERTGVTSLKGSPKIVEKSYCVTGNFLTSLKGAPSEIEGYFEASNNMLASLIGGPKIVKGSFRVTKNKLKTLEGCPQEIGYYLNCRDNPIENFHYLPNILGGDLEFTVNDKITQYEGMGFKEIEKLNIAFKEKKRLDKELEDYANLDVHGPVFKL